LLQPERPIIPQPLMAQLKNCGKLVIPVGEKDQIMTMESGKNDQFERSMTYDFKFVPLLKNKIK
jgi:protein-L-isoaspartate(D-aspartate) O-methyltransferase